MLVMKLDSRLPGLFVAAASVFGVSLASAHVRLIDPPPRVDGKAGGMQLKNGPCGQTPNARTTIVTEFSPGETITVTFAEYINHTSYYRVALDVDGDDDFPLRPNQSVMPGDDDPTMINPVSDISDTSLPVYILGYDMDDLSPAPMQEQEYTMQVTLPNIECENCTLQLIQFMYNDDMPYYFQCADIVMRGTVADSTTSTMSTGAGGMMGTATDSTVTTVTGTTGAGGAGMTVTTGSDSTTASTSASATVSSTSGTTGGTMAAATVTNTSAATSGGPTGTATTGALDTSTGGVPPAAEPADEGGCSCRAARGGSSGLWLAALLPLGVFGYRRRARPA